jgi:hypothetical protein
MSQRKRVFTPTQTLGVWLVAGIALALAVACQSGDSNAQSGVSPSPTSQISAPIQPTEGSPQSIPTTPRSPVTSQPIAAIFEPGDYCFEVNDATLTSVIQLTVTPGNTVYGKTQATIHNEPSGYYSSYSQVFEGEVRGDRLDLNIITEIELDTQNTQETWTTTNSSPNSSLIIRDVSYARVDCSPEAEPPISVHIFRTQFAPGARSTVIENAVIRGERDIYLLNAREGQQMQVQITALEENAVVDILAPGGEVIQQEVTQAEIQLPSTGDFQIVVGGTRGNASYRLEVGID